MKIAILTNAPSPYRVDFFEYLSRVYSNEHDFSVIFSSSNEDIGRAWGELENEAGERVTQKYVLRPSYYFLDSRTLKKEGRFDTRTLTLSSGLWKLLRIIRPDVMVIAEYNPSAILASIYCRLEGIPFVSWTDGTVFSERNIGLAQKLVRKFMIASATAYLASSTRAKENQIMLGAKEEKIFTSFLTVDIEKYLVPESEVEGDFSVPELEEKKGFSGVEAENSAETVSGNLSGYRSNDKKTRLISVGSLIERKGMDLLLREMTYLSEGYELIIVGDGLLKEELIKQAEVLGLKDRVRFVGFLDREALCQEYKASDIFVLLTREDCFGLVILEAMCAGLPTVVSKYADGAVDLIEDGVSGFIVDIDREGASAEAIQKVAEKKTCEKMSKAAYEKTKDFAFEKVEFGFMEAVKFANTVKKR